MLHSTFYWLHMASPSILLFLAASLTMISFPLTSGKAQLMSTGFAVVPRRHVQRYFDRWPGILNGSLYEMMRYGAPANLKLSPHFFGGSVFEIFDLKNTFLTIVSVVNCLKTM